MNKSLIRNEDTVSKLNKVLNDIQSTFKLKEDIKLYYVSEDADIEGYIAIKYRNEYYKLNSTDSFGIKLGVDYYRNNPYVVIAGIKQTIDIGDNLITDKNIIDKLDSLEDNETYMENMLDEKYKCDVLKIKDTLDNVLSKITLSARSNKKEGFYKKDKLDAIENVLKDSKYNKVYETKNCVVYGLKEPKEGDKCVLVSSHADIVSGITNPDSQYKDGYYHGTYDNLGTNASAVTLMLNDDKLVNNNVYFAFTAEEETGICSGAKDALEFINCSSKRHPLCVALDVTDEGYDENKLISVEGLHGSIEMCDKIGKLMLETDGELPSFNVVRLSPKAYTPFNDSYISCDSTEFDESVFYGKMLHQDALSLCVPTDGYMHSNAGLDIKESTFMGYIYSLNVFLQSFTNTLDKDKLKTIKDFKDYLTYKTMRLSKKAVPKFKPNYYNSFTKGNNEGYKYYSFSDAYDFEDEYEETDTFIESAFETDDKGNIIDKDAYEEAYETLMDFASSYPDDYDTYIADISEVYGNIPIDAAQAAYNEFYGLCFDHEGEDDDYEL